MLTNSLFAAKSASLSAILSATATLLEVLAEYTPLVSSAMPLKPSFHQALSQLSRQLVAGKFSFALRQDRASIFTEEPGNVGHPRWRYIFPKDVGHYWRLVSESS